MKSILWVALLLTAMAPASGMAQGIAIAPTSVFIDARARTGLLLLVNPNDEPAEVEISTFFGYPVTDTAGQVQLHTVEGPDSNALSAAGWIRVFPRRATLAPHTQQTVRLLVSPPPEIPDGEYWSRLAIVARGGKLPVTAATDSGAVQVGLSRGTDDHSPAVPQGETGDRRRAFRPPGGGSGDSLVVRSRLERRGNAAALATVRGKWWIRPGGSRHFRGPHFDLLRHGAALHRSHRFTEAGPLSPAPGSLVWPPGHPS